MGTPSPSACMEIKDGTHVAKVVLMPGDPLRAKYVAETYLENPEAYVTVHAWIPGNIWFSWALKPGETLEYLTEGDGYAWYDLKTGSRFDSETPVYHNMILQKRQSVEREAP